MNKQYYFVLLEISTMQTVWLVPQDDGIILWTEEIKRSRPFHSITEARKKTEDYMESVLGFETSYKIIEFSEKEVRNFLLAIS